MAPEVRGSRIAKLRITATKMNMKITRSRKPGGESKAGMRGFFLNTAVANTSCSHGDHKGTASKKIRACEFILPAHPSSKPNTAAGSSSEACWNNSIAERFLTDASSSWYILDCKL